MPSGRLLLGNSLWNLIGEGLPLIVAIFAVPPTIRGLGTERFGVIATSWLVVGYLSVLDLGLSRALTKYIPETIAKGDDYELPHLFWTAVELLIAFAFIAMFSIVFASHWIVYHGLRVPEALRPEAQLAFYAVGLALPALLLSASARGTLAGFQRFDLINAVRIPLSVYSYVAPLLLMWVTRDLSVIIGMLVAGRAVAGVIELFMCLRVAPALRCIVPPSVKHVRRLVGFGAWVMVTLIVNPLLVYSDRLMIGGLLSMSAVTYYATPLEVMSKLSIVPAAISQVMFPALSFGLSVDRTRAARAFECANKYLLSLLFPAALVMVTLAPELLRLWLGRVFADASATTTQILAIYIMITGLTWMPDALINAAGRPDYLSKMVLAESPFVIAMIWFMIRYYGISGVAIACIARGIVNVSCSMYFVKCLVPALGTEFRRTLLAMAGSVCILIVLVALGPQLGVRLGIASSALLIFAWSTWRGLFSADEREFVARQLRIARSPG